jgi:hypothetical protein
VTLKNTGLDNTGEISGSYGEYEDSHIYKMIVYSVNFVRGFVYIQTQLHGAEFFL